MIRLILNAFVVLSASIILFCSSVECHELDGKIWRQRDSAFLTFRQMVDDLEEKKFLVVGETHGFQPHQDREAYLVSALAERGLYPALVLEMLDPDGALKLAEYRRTHPEDVSSLAQSLDWENSGWPAFSYYEPVFSVAFRAKLAVVGGDLPAALSLLAVPPSIQQNDLRLASWKQTMKIAHCGIIAPDELVRTALRQMARDQSMAYAALSADEKSSAIVVSGLEHARADRGIPTYMAGKDVSSVALVEISESTDPANYLPPSLGKVPPFDYLWFTPARNQEGACERLKNKGLLK